MKRLKQRVAIVTAGANGIGAACARAMAAAGARVAIADRHDATVLAREIEEEGGSAMAMTVDVSDDMSAQAMVRTVADHFGRIDIIVNSVACSTAQPKRFSDIALIEWDRVVAHSLRSIFVCTRAAVPFMRRNRYGRIINLCPGSGAETDRLLHYATANGAILALTQALAGELEPEGIRVKALAGHVDCDEYLPLHLIAPLLALAAESGGPAADGGCVMH